VVADCFVCDKHAAGEMRDGLVVFEDELVIASHSLVGDRGDAYLGYLFVEPKRHVAGLGELTADEAAAVGRLTNDVARALRGPGRAEHVYLFVLGHDVAHLHLHVVARYPGAPPEFRGLRAKDWPDAPRGDLAATQRLCARLRAELEP